MTLNEVRERMMWCREWDDVRLELAHMCCVALNACDEKDARIAILEKQLRPTTVNERRAELGLVPLEDQA